MSTAGQGPTGRLTTHVLDTMSGRPGAGLAVELLHIEGEARRPLRRLMTDDDGRTPEPLLAGSDLVRGTYELVFHVGDYFRARGVALTEFRECHATSGAAAIVRIEHSHASRCGNLARQAVAGEPAVADVGFRTSVDSQNKRIPLASFFIQRADENAFQFETVAGFVTNDFLASEAQLLQSRIAVGPALG